MACITSQDVRHYLEDREPEDNELEIDLFFSDEELEVAMRAAAREYNGIPPKIDSVDADTLSDTTNMFFDGILAHLYISRRGRLMRNEIDFTAGGVTTNIQSKRISYFNQLIKEHRDAFQTAARDHKNTLNLLDGYGSVG